MKNYIIKIEKQPLNNKNINLKLIPQFSLPGKRRCLGEALAKSNLFLFFAAFMHAFIVEPANPGQLPPLEGFDGITLSPQPYQVRLKERLIWGCEAPGLYKLLPDVLKKKYKAYLAIHIPVLF